jgi:hypothetical protein
MAVVQSYETFVGRQVFTFRLVDQFAFFLRTQGPYPPLVGTVRIFVTQRTDIGRSYDPEREVLVWPNAMGCFLTGGDVLPANSGDPSFVLAAGTYKMRIESDFYLPDELTVTWPPVGVIEEKLFPTPAYPFPDFTANPAGMGTTMIRGCLFAPDGTPRVGVAVSVSIQEPLWAIPAEWPFAKAKTNDKGEWLLMLPDQREMIDPPPAPLLKTIHLRYAIDGQDFDELVQAGRENRYLQATLRGSAADKNGRPLAGVKVQNSLRPGTSITGPDGRWSIYFPFDQTDAACTVTATDPGGHVLNRNTNVLAHKTVIVDRFQFL